MWIIVGQRSYYSGSDEFGHRFHSDREFAKRFESKKDAEQFKKQNSISGSIIPY